MANQIKLLFDLIYFSYWSE